MRAPAMIGCVLFPAILIFSCMPAMAENPRSWQEICRQVANHPFPPEDRPTADVVKTLQNCSSYNLYYGFYEDRDPEMARLCAYDEMNRQDDSSPFVGEAMLMTIYANGVGARRDLDLAIRLACKTGWAPAEIEGRVKHLAELREQNWQGKDFSLCDDITSGYMAAFCADHGEKFASSEREERLDRIQASWTPADMKEYAALRTVADRYFEVHADNEVDRTGTASAALHIADTASLEEQFVSMVEMLEKRTFPRSSRQQFTDADARLNAVYAKVQAADLDDRGGSVTKEGIRDTQRMWLRYRDAWLKFCRKRYPGLTADSIKAYLTEKRIEELTEFAE